MKKYVAEDLFEFEYPDGFHVMTPEETGKLKFIENGSGVCLSDPARHMLVSFGWRKVGSLVSKIVSLKDISNSMQKSVAKGNAPYDYRKGTDLSRMIAGEPARGFDYYYTVQGIEMYGRSYVMKYNKRIVYLNIYGRTSYDDSGAVLEEICDSIK